MKKVFLLVFVICVGFSSVWGITQYGRIQMKHEAKIQARIIQNMPALMAAIRACNKWQSQDEWYNRFMDTSRIVSDESPCKTLE